MHGIVVKFPKYNQIIATREMFICILDEDTARKLAFSLSEILTIIFNKI